MAFVPFDWDELEVGKPLTKEKFDKLKNNFDDLDQRINSLETTGGSVFICNQVFKLAGLTVDDPYVFYYKVPKNIAITEVRAQIFDKGLITSGTLSIDVQKSIDTNNANFNSILTDEVDFDYAVDTAYSAKTAAINSAVSNITSGSVLRVKIASVPANFGGKLLLLIGAE